MWWKKIIQVFFGVVLGLVLLMGGLFGYFYFHQSQIMKVIVDQVNKRVNTTIDVSKISLSLWERFPSVSVKFENVIVYNAKNFNSHKNDTLLRAKSVFADLDLVSLFSDDPKIQAVSVTNGVLYVAVDKHGVYNYNVIKPSLNQTESQPRVTFNKVELTRIAIQYDDYRSKMNYRAFFPIVRLQGSMGDFGFALKAYISMRKNNLVPSFNNFVQTVEYEGTVSYFDKKLIEWKGKAGIDDCNFSVSGFYNIDNEQILVESDEVIINNAQIIRLLSKINTSGFLFAESSIKLTDFRYLQSSSTLYQITAGFHVKSALRRSGDVFDVEANGRANFNGKSLYSKFDAFDMKTKSSHAHFMGGFDWPKNKISGHFSLGASLDELTQLMNINTLTHPTGTIDVQANVEGVIGKDGDYFSLINNGEVGFNKVAFNYENYKIENLSGMVEWENALNCSSQLKVEVNGVALNYVGKWHNIPGFVSNKETLDVSGTLRSPNVDWDKLIVQKADTSSSALAIPQNLNFDMHVEMGQFSKSPFAASNIHFDLITTGKRFDLRKMKLDMADGNVDITARMIQQQNNEWYTTFSAKLYRVDVSKTFTRLNNFGQENLVDKNLSGLLTAVADGDFVLSPDLSIKIPTVFLESDVSISNGAIINYKALEALSDFVAVDELQHVKFSELKNTIRISNNTLFIPYMNIKSSVLDLGLEGSHQFNNQINYRVSIGLSDILFSKFKQKHKEINPLRRNKKMVVDVDISGSIDDYKISMSKLHRQPAEKPIESPKEKKKFEIEFDDIK